MPLADVGALRARFRVVRGRTRPPECGGDVRRPPLSPAAFAKALASRRFTNGADSAVVEELYRKTAEAVLGNTPSLVFDKLSWGEEEWRQLGEALPLCRKLTVLKLTNMKNFTDGAQWLNFSALTALKELNLSECGSLTAVPDLSALTALEKLNLSECGSLTAVPDLSGLEARGCRVYRD